MNFTCRPNRRCSFLIRRHQIRKRSNCKAKIKKKRPEISKQGKEKGTLIFLYCYVCYIYTIHDRPKITSKKKKRISLVCLFVVFLVLTECSRSAPGSNRILRDIQNQAPFQSRYRQCSFRLSSVSAQQSSLFHSIERKNK